MKLHEIMITGLLITVIFVGVMLVYFEGATQYGLSDVDTSQMSSFNESLYAIQNTSGQVSEAMSNLQGSPDVFDILGSVFTGGYAAIKTAVISFGAITGATTTAITILPIGGMRDILILFAGGALVIVAFIAILGHYIGKSDRL